MTDTLLDVRGRAYAALDDLYDGCRIELDDGFDCVQHIHDVPTTRTVLADDKGLYFTCSSGKHYLRGQLDDDGRSLIGVYKAVNGCHHG